MPKVIRNQPTDDPDYLARLAQEYRDAKAFAEKAQERADALKADLSAAVEAQGYPDEKGSLWLDAGSYELKRERRVSKNLDAAAALEWAQTKPLPVWESVVENVPTVNEDRLLALAWERPDMADAIGDLYKERVTWAFRLIEKKHHPGSEEQE